MKRQREREAEKGQEEFGLKVKELIKILTDYSFFSSEFLSSNLDPLLTCTFNNVSSALSEMLEC